MSAFRRFGGVIPLGLMAIGSTFLLAAVSSAARLPSLPPNAVTITAKYGGELTVDPTRFHVYDIPRMGFERITGFSPDRQATEAPLGRQILAPAAATGRVLTILVEWENHPANPLLHPAEAYDSLLYSDHLYPTGSVRDYYEEVSYGSFGVTGAVFGWVYLSSWYNGWYNINEIVATVDPFVNFADYDGDHDGYVDALWIIHAGPGQEETHDPNDIWSHAYRGVHVPTSDGVALDRWSVQPEQHMSGEIISIRVFCHEYGHILGMPDLYDYDGKLDTATYFTPNDENDHPLVDWDVMGYGGYNIMAYGNRSCPSHFCGWSRTFLGWATPVIPTCLEGTYTLYNIEEHAAENLFKIPINAQGTEYFLLEYRNPGNAGLFDHLNSDFSAYCPWFTPGRDTLDAGLLITHIDDLVSPNDGTPSYSHYAVTVVDAGYDPAHPWNGTEFTEWWYPYEFRVGTLYSPNDPGQTLCSPTTTPSSNGYSGSSGISIEVLSQTSDQMTIRISKPQAPVLMPVAPIVIEVSETREVLISATDANCTAPALSALGLPNYAAFVDSGNGHGTLSLAPLPGDEGVRGVLAIADDGALTDTFLVRITVTSPSCLCPCVGDPQCDSLANVQDVVQCVNVAFRGAAPTVDPQCPQERTDVDCDAVTTLQDVVRVINVSFRGAVKTTEFCDPCTTP
ncbi:MAG: M6 family metalloprotease domain-containing protein [Candidatus Zixiibacteriota bacterium]